MRMAAQLPDFYAHRRRSPHFRVASATCFVTWRLHSRQVYVDVAERSVVVAAIRHFDRQSLAEVHRQSRQRLAARIVRSRDSLRGGVFDALIRRLQSIPDEIASEEAAIRTRDADPRPRLFPVALT